MKLTVLTILAISGIAPLPSVLARLGPNERNDRQLYPDQVPQNHPKKKKLKHRVGGNRIVGGSVAPEGQYPFFVDWGGCGASLIHSDIILTAAHCDPVEDTSVYVGAYREGVGEQHQIVTRQIHPQFDESTMSNDFMILKIDTLSTMTPVALNGDDNNPTDGEDLVILGHGDTADGANDFPDTLLEAMVPYIDSVTCNGPSMYNGIIYEDVMFCAGFAGGGIDSCQGDSGGPVLEFDGSNYVQVGIVSWGFGCAQPNYPGVYSRVSGAKTWIEEQICALSSDPPSSCSSEGTTPSAPTSTPASSGGGGQVAVRVDITYDFFPEEIGWSINQGGNTIVSFQPGTLFQAGLVSETVNLNPGQYTFTITDTMGDGICCNYGNGFYQVFADVNGVETLIAEGSGEFAFSQTTTLNVPESSRASSKPPRVTPTAPPTSPVQSTTAPVQSTTPPTQPTKSPTTATTPPTAKPTTPPTQATKSPTTAATTPPTAKPTTPPTQATTPPTTAATTPPTAKPTTPPTQATTKAPTTPATTPPTAKPTTPPTTPATTTPPTTSTTTPPTAKPTTSQGADCQDSNSLFEVDTILGNQGCSWLADNLDRFDYLCRFVDIAVVCPATCNSCDLVR